MKNTELDFWILSSFRERVIAIPNIHERTIPAAQALVEEANRAIAELKRNGHSHQDALDLCNSVVNMVQDALSNAQRKRNERLGQRFSYGEAA